MAANRKTYVKTQWVNDETPLDEEHLNNLEEGVEINNALAKENANYIDEIYAAFIQQTTLAFNSETNELTLSFGSTSGSNPTTRFNASFAVGLPVNIDIVNFAREIYTERHIEDLEISCPPITYGIAGGEAEIATGIQQLTVLYGNGTTGVKSAKVISRGKNQFAGFNEFIRVLSSEEYRIFTNLPSGLLLTEYNSDKELYGGYEDEPIGTDCIVHGYENENDLYLSEETSYIKLAPANPTEVTEDTEVMVYLTFGESYSEEYEEPRVDEIVLPNITLRSVDDVRDEIYAKGGGIRRISEQGEILQSPTVISNVENPGWDPELFVDNYGTILFLDENDEEIKIEQPYQIIYKISLAEFLDSAFVKAKGNASDIAKESDLKEGKLVVALSKESENLTSYSENSGFIDKTAFTFQTAGGESDVGYKAFLNKLIGNSESDGDYGFKHAQSSKYTMAGYNQNDEEYEEGDIDGAGTDIVDSDWLRNKNFIRVFEDTTYGIVNQSEVKNLHIYYYDETKTIINDAAVSGDTFTIPSSVSYIRFSFKKQDEPKLCFFLFWDGSKITYEPHYKKEYNLPNIELKKCGNATDTLYPDGTLIKRVGELDLGSIDYQIDSDRNAVSVNPISNIKIPESINTNANLVCTRFNLVNESDTIGFGIAVKQDGSIRICDEELFGKTAEQVKEYLNHIYILYELAEPVVTQNDEYKFEQVTEIDDFGTQEFDSEVAQGAEFFYACDYKAFIDTLGGRDDIQYDANKIASVEMVPTADKVKNKIENDPRKAFIILGSVQNNNSAIEVRQPTVVAITSHGFRNTPHFNLSKTTVYHGAFKGTKRGNRPILLLGDYLDWDNKNVQGMWDEYAYYNYEDIIQALPGYPGNFDGQDGNKFIYKIDIDTADLTAILEDASLSDSAKESNIKTYFGNLGVHPHKLLIYDSIRTFHAFRKFMVKFFHPDKYDNHWFNLPGTLTTSHLKRFFADVYLDILVKLEIPAPGANGISTAKITYTVQRKFFDR